MTTINTKEALINSRCVKRRENFSSDVLKIRRHTDVCQGFLVQNDGKFAADAHIDGLFRGSLNTDLKVLDMLLLDTRAGKDTIGSRFVSD